MSTKIPHNQQGDPIAAKPIPAENLTTNPSVADDSTVKETTVKNLYNNNQQIPSKKIDIFEKGIKNITSFIAKNTGQPDPETGVELQENEPTFFNKLIKGTKNLLSHAETFTEKTLQTTKNISKKVIDLPGKVIGGTVNVVQKGVDIGNNIKDQLLIQSEKIGKNLETGKDLLKTGVNAALDTTEKLGDGIIYGGKQMIKNPLEGTDHIIKTVGSTAQELGKQTIQETKKAGKHITNLGSETLSTIESSKPKNNQNTVEDQGNLIAEIQKGGENLLKKGKNIGNKVANTTKNIISNPIEQFDHFIGNHQSETVTIDPKDPNKQTLNQLENQQISSQP